jgi:hypothetical protein
MSESKTESMSESMSTHLLREIEAMVVHLSGSGQTIPAAALNVLARWEAGDTPTMLELGQAHAMLADAASPALPRTLSLLSEHRRDSGTGPLRDVFSLPLTYRFIVISIAALTMNLVLSSLGADELVPNPHLPWAERPLVHAVLVRAYVVGQAALGAAFNILWTANTYVTRGTYDPRHDATYLIRFVMGIISGVLLAGIGGEQLTAEQLDSFPIGLLALVGGFSASLLHRVLQRLVGAVESLLAGDGRDARELAQEQARTKLSNAVLGERVKLQAQLQQLRSVGERDPAAARRMLDELLAGIDARVADEGTTRPKSTVEPEPASEVAPASAPAPASVPAPAPAPAPASASAPAPASPPPADPNAWPRRKLDPDS